MSHKAKSILEKERKDLAATIGAISAMKADKFQTIPIEAYESVLVHWSNMLTMSSLLVDILEAGNGSS